VVIIFLIVASFVLGVIAAKLDQTLVTLRKLRECRPVTSERINLSSHSGDGENSMGRAYSQRTEDDNKPEDVPEHIVDDLYAEIRRHADPFSYSTALALAGRALASLAQSDAQPVAWRYLPPADESWRATTDPEKARLGREEYGWHVEPLYTAPPRPDAQLVEVIPDCPTEGIAARQGNGG
jgi:hypothetical protein